MHYVDIYPHISSFRAMPVYTHMLKRFEDSVRTGLTVDITGVCSVTQSPASCLVAVLTAVYGDVLLTGAIGDSEVPNSGLFSQGEKLPLHRYATSLHQHFVVALETSQRKAGAGPEVERLLRRPFLLHQTHVALTLLCKLHSKPCVAENGDVIRN